MKKIIIVAAVLLVGLFAYSFLRIDTVQQDQLATYTSAELGIQFDYKIGPDGYILEELIPADIGELVRVIVLVPAEEGSRVPPEGGEGPATITMSILRNEQDQAPLAWAEDNQEYSNINLKIGEISQAIIAGADAIRYMADGLYVSDNVVIAHEGNIYVVSGMFMDQDSDIRRDYQPLIDSLEFIPVQIQE